MTARQKGHSIEVPLLEIGMACLAAPHPIEAALLRVAWLNGRKGAKQGPFQLKCSNFGHLGELRLSYP
jgi:hypothetical protein